MSMSLLLILLHRICVDTRDPQYNKPQRQHHETSNNYPDNDTRLLKRRSLRVLDLAGCGCLDRVVRVIRVAVLSLLLLLTVNEGSVGEAGEVLSVHDDVVESGSY